MEGRAYVSPVPMVHPMFGIDVWKPVIAAINGICVAGGLELALACDIRIASEHARFGPAEVRYGIIPGTGGTQRLLRLIPFGHALEMLMTGELIDAQEAYRLGLVNKVTSLDHLMSTAEKLTETINFNGPLAVRAVKEASHRGIQVLREQGLRFERLCAQLVHFSEDAAESLLAFAERRKPVYGAK